jgi:hypothetical protein
MSEQQELRYVNVNTQGDFTIEEIDTIVAALKSIGIPNVRFEFQGVIKFTTPSQEPTPEPTPPPE